MLICNRWAANALLVPSLDMLSNLSTSDAKSIVEHVANHRPRSSPMWWHWRGRIGLTEDEQAALWAKIEKHLPPRVDVSTDSTSVTPNTAPSVPLTFRTYEGEKRSVPARLGDSLLQVGKANDLPSLEGTCGGNLGEYSPGLCSYRMRNVPPVHARLGTHSTAIRGRAGYARIRYQL